ncbi:DNA alkylation repair protein [Bacillus ndiopicus]|uniref:DNA alkylation repair protein n=1 Tax=Bacillus ndiopicus TaxID=1347368 RepID=UPI0005A87BBD|nr:DNA alkylation repair protein [Bacillus ndiopicus]
MSENTALKHYFGVELARRLSSLIEPHFPNFPSDSFIESVANQVEPLALKGRVTVISDELRIALPSDYSESLSILLKILGRENETEQGMFTNGYFLMPVAYFVEKYGLQHFEISMNALYEITKRHTSEYAVRPYLANSPNECLIYLNNWLYDPNPHVRRLVSEGTRPRLPWAKRMHAIKGDPANNLNLLAPLLKDPSDYVRKSVANHLNDLTKDYRDVTLDWLRCLNLEDADIKWIIRRGLRSLASSEDSEALELLAKL